MLRNAPKFFEVAKRIVEITDGCILVAHNAEFDYRILSTEFRRLGFEYERESLCTVELSKHLIPDMPSYSLGKLVRSLGIPVTDRHRASGDAQATVKLFKILLDKDSKKNIIKDAVRLNTKRQLEAKHLDILANLPTITGVYYMHNSAGEIIYIGKSNNIKKRVNQHFTNSNQKSKKIQSLVTAVTYEATGNELVALLKENEEIQRNKPKFNKAQKLQSSTYALYTNTDEQKYINLIIDKTDYRKKPITTFSNLQSAKRFLEIAIEEYGLCQNLVGKHNNKLYCYIDKNNECSNVCSGKETFEVYNKRIAKLINKNSYAKKSMVIVDKGRDLDERSVILIKNGIFQGLGFINLNYQISNINVLESIITPMANNRNTQHIIQSYMRRHKKIKIININHE